MTEAQTAAKIFSLAQCRITSLPNLQNVQKIIFTSGIAIYISSDGVITGKSREYNLDLWRTELGGTFIDGEFLTDSFLNVKLVTKSDSQTKIHTYRISTQNGTSQLISTEQSDAENTSTQSLESLQGESFRITTKGKKILRIDSHNNTATIYTYFVPEEIFKINAENFAVSDKAGNFQMFHLNSLKKSWKYRFGSSISNILTDDDFLYIASLDGFVYKFERRRGKMIWKRRFDSRPLKMFIQKDLSSISENIFLIQSGLNPARVFSKSDGQIIETFELNEDENISAVLSDEDKIVTNQRLIDLKSCQTKNGT